MDTNDTCVVGITSQLFGRSSQLKIQTSPPQGLKLGLKIEGQKHRLEEEQADISLQDDG